MPSYSVKTGHTFGGASLYLTASYAFYGHLPAHAAAHAKGECLSSVGYGSATFSDSDKAAKHAARVGGVVVPTPTEPGDPDQVSWRRNCWQLRQARQAVATQSRDCPTCGHKATL